jgi:hypothetical protein
MKIGRQESGTGVSPVIFGTEDGRDARPTLLPRRPLYFDRNESHAISGKGH